MCHHRFAGEGVDKGVTLGFAGERRGLADGFAELRKALAAHDKLPTTATRAWAVNAARDLLAAFDAGDSR